MCLAAFLIGHSERFPFVLASNRDEFFARASQPLQWWQPEGSASPVLSGKDLTGGGTWLGLNAAGRLALVTNVREPGRNLVASPSRGELVLQCLANAQLDLTDVAQVPRNGFNLLHVDLQRACVLPTGQPVGVWVSNRPTVQQAAIHAGAFGLSNAALDTPWPKVSLLKQRLAQALEQHHELDALLAKLFAALADEQPAADAALPNTGVSHERERQLSSAFIRIDGADSGTYGTRCSTLVVVQARAGRHTVHVVERTHAESAQGGVVQDTRFVLPLPLPLPLAP
jgi:uncharacterized protein with NRDE domain